jgi:hypothetical protein
VVEAADDPQVATLYDHLDPRKPLLFLIAMGDRGDDAIAVKRALQILCVDANASTRAQLRIFGEEVDRLAAPLADVSDHYPLALDKMVFLAVTAEKSRPLKLIEDLGEDLQRRPVEVEGLCKVAHGESVRLFAQGGQNLVEVEGERGLCRLASSHVLNLLIRYWTTVLVHAWGNFAMMKISSTILVLADNTTIQLLIFNGLPSSPKNL